VMPFTSAARTSFPVQPSSLRNGDGLWPEFKPWLSIKPSTRHIAKSSRNWRLSPVSFHGQTKMESLMKCQAANLHYLVVEPRLVEEHEIPSTSILPVTFLTSSPPQT